jgi:hypothetical protein
VEVDTMFKIAILIPTTSNRRDAWKSITDSYLFNVAYPNILETRDEEHHYIFYIGYDKNDRIFSKPQEQQKVKDMEQQKVKIHFIEFKNIQKGHVTKMWNVLFKSAYDDGCDYFYQCGDDIKIDKKGWVNESIGILQQHKNIGIAGPKNTSSGLLLTQVLVSRVHMELFGWFFPEEIINWCCDDWYLYVYSPTFCFPLKNYFVSNNGGTPRYTIHNDIAFEKDLYNSVMTLRTKIVRDMVPIHKQKIIEYFNTH